MNAQIDKAKELGLCFGVRRAVKMLKQGVGKYGEVETLGPLAHNKQLVQGLAEIGIRAVENLGQVQGKILAITAHGTSPEILSEIEARRIHIIDTTCPIVHKAQRIAKELAEAGYQVIIFGEAEHQEVKGLLGWARGKGIAEIDAKEIHQHSNLSPRLSIIAQTTQGQSDFIEFTKQLMTTFSPRVKDLRIVNTLCRTTQRRREAAMRLARKSDLMLVVGGSNSANTKRLAEACSPIVEAHLVEGAEGVSHSWLMGKRHIGIAAGASTPDEAVEELIDKLTSLTELGT